MSAAPQRVGGRPAGSSPAGRPQHGAVSLELALATPALFLLLLLVFHAAVFGRDVLLVQTAARQGARVAATSTEDSAVRAAVVEALDGRQAAVTVSPRGHPGSLVRVTVTLTSAAGVGRHPTVRATAAAAVEPVVGP